MPNEVRINNDTDEHESAHFFVCARVSDVPVGYFADDLFDFCTECGEKVRFRPHGPIAPKKICVQCALPSLIEAKSKGELEIVASAKSAKEFREKTGERLDASLLIDKIDTYKP